MMSVTNAWYHVLSDCWRLGRPVAPRGQKTVEVLDARHAYDASLSILSCPPRELSYRFAAAEAAWILRGDDRVEPLAKHAPSIARFSDDGETLAGAYGPRVRYHLPDVASALVRDRDTRQAVLPIWDRGTDRASKDVPCTVYLNFSIRGSELLTFVRMRSSDAWLGFPYDAFSFACVAVAVACHYNEHRARSEDLVTPGRVFWSADSSHLYERDWARALRCLDHLKKTARTHHALDAAGFARAGLIGLEVLRLALAGVEETNDPTTLSSAAHARIDS